MKKKILKWSALTFVAAALAGLLAFLYFIPPFFSVSSEQYVKDAAGAHLSLDGVSDPGKRAMAERGRYIVMITGCSDCHSTPGPQGPRADMYMAGGMKVGTKVGGATVSRNLTPDRKTGIGALSDEEILRVLRSGVFQDGRVVIYRHMPWAALANWTEEDRRAVVAYLRLINPIEHQIPDPMPSAPLPDPGAVEMFYSQNYGVAGGATKP